MVDHTSTAVAIVGESVPEMGPLNGVGTALMKSVELTKTVKGSSRYTKDMSEDDAVAIRKSVQALESTFEGALVELQTTHNPNRDAFRMFLVNNVVAIRFEASRGYFSRQTDSKHPDDSAVSAASPQEKLYVHPS
uniref:Uncharacterized protein n=1 Tax=Moniliophthora roreri TaxID=221103 RepID=A0A0W0FBU6_MONRR